MSSISDAIHYKILPRSEELERIFSRDFLLKIIFSYKFRINSDDPMIDFCVTFHNCLGSTNAKKIRFLC